MWLMKLSHIFSKLSDVEMPTLCVTSIQLHKEHPEGGSTDSDICDSCKEF